MKFLKKNDSLKVRLNIPKKRDQFITTTALSCPESAFLPEKRWLDARAAKHV